MIAPAAPKFFLSLLLSLLLALLLPASAAEALLLDRSRADVEAWPAVTILADPGGRLTAEQALAAADRFSVPNTAYATLGVQKDVIWVRIPLQLAANASNEWILHINYAMLNRVDVYTGTPSQLTLRDRLGNLQPYTSGAPQPRTPATLLNLTPGSAQMLLLRVENVGAMILPIHLSRPGLFHARALNEQMLQGMLIGLSLCLLLYGLAQWVNLREHLFGKFALLIAATTLFSVEFTGLGSQYLWHYHPWMTQHAGGLFALLASCGAYLFVGQALARPGMDRLFLRLMHGGAALTLLAAATYALDLIGVQTLVAIVSTLGVLPMLLGLPGAFLRARRGDPVGVYFLIGWSVSFATSVILSQVISGAVAANFWTMHALQFGNVFDMLIFMRILGLRTKAMQSAMLRAEAATRMKSDFLANMSHEIRTPLNAIIGMSRLALMADPSPKLRNYVGKIQGAGEHLLAIINDILDFSRIEAGKLTVECVPFELNELLEHLSNLSAVKTDAQGVELVFHIGRDVPARLVGDPLRLGQVLINLTSNAIKFTTVGEVVIAVAVLARQTDSVTLELSVSDTGIGMDEVQLARLFQAFTQADSSVTRKYGGTGLGLSISKRLIELMGGSIQARSTPGVGSRFSVTLTLGVASAAPLVAPAHALQQLRVLVVDDSATARAALLDMLASLGITAQAVPSGEQSLAMLARAAASGEPYHVVLIDYLMPGWDGLDTMRRIHADPRCAAPTTILMVSAGTQAALLQQQYQQHDQTPLHDFLTKPVGPALLYQSLLQVVQPAPARTGNRLPDLAALDGARILLVEDNANNREVVIDFLSSARIHIDVAVHGGQALQMVQDAHYDLVLMDIQMQQIDGLTAARRIRTIGHLRHLPIIAMTARAMASDRDNSLMAGMNDHLTKPIDPDLLFRTLLQWIPRQHRASQSTARVVALSTPAPAAPCAPPALPLVAGIDWQRALENVDQQRPKLERRVRGFIQEYGSAPNTLRSALAGADHATLQSVAHNLRPSAAYLGATMVSALATQVEQDLRAGRPAVSAAALATALELVLDGLAQLRAAPALPHYDGAAVGRLIQQLEACLLQDDARAEDLLAELQGRLTASGHHLTLAAIQHAVDDLEYAVALAPLATLAAALHLNLEESV